MAESNPHIRSLTGLRFFAAIAVVIYHYGLAHLRGWPRSVQNIAGAGYVGVSFFFVLSGFILTYTYAGASGGRPRALRKREFWVARFARIYPMYALSLLLALPYWVVTLLSANRPAVAAFKGLVQGGAVATLLQAWTPRTLGVWNYPAWSLSVEAAFYLLFPFLLPRLRALSPRGIARGLAVAWLAAVAGPLTLAWIYRGVGDAQLAHAGATLHTIALYHPLAHVPQFVFGMLLGLRFVQRLADPTRQAERPAAQWLPPAAVALTLGALSYSDRFTQPLLSAGLLAPLFGLLASSLAAHGGPLGRVLGSRPLVLLGDASYAVYILQFPVWLIAGTLVEKLGLGRPGGFGYFAAYSTALVGASVLLYRGFEVPAREFVRRALRGPATVTTKVDGVPVSGS